MVLSNIQLFLWIWCQFLSVHTHVLRTRLLYFPLTLTPIQRRKCSCSLAFEFFTALFFLLLLKEIYNFLYFSLKVQYTSLDTCCLAHMDLPEQSNQGQLGSVLIDCA